MKLLIVEGTVEEIREVIPMLQTFTSGTTIFAPQSDDPKPASGPQQSGERKPVTVEFALRALTRRPLSKPQRKVLKALYDAHPKHLTSPALQEVAGYQSSHQLAGLMGAFGRRLSNTAGFDENAVFFEWRQDDKTGIWEYRLADTVLQAFKRAGLIVSS